MPRVAPAKPPLHASADDVERVAQAIYENRVDHLPASLADREMSPLERVLYVRQAKAALKAMGYETGAP